MNTRKHWLDQPKNIKRLWRGFLFVLALTVMAEFAVHLHPQFEIEGLFAFHAVYGFVGCALMIMVAKGLGLFLKRPDSFYAKDQGDE
jgi:hypothetical protein